MDVEQVLLSYFASHVKATREELIAWAVSYNFSKIQAGDAILDLSIDAKIHWQYDHWVKDPKIEVFPLIPERPLAPAPVVETTVTTSETVSITQTTTVSVQKTTRVAITLKEMVQSYLDAEKPRIKPVPSDVRAWVEAKFHQSFTRKQVSSAISRSYGVEKVVIPENLPLATPKPALPIALPAPENKRLDLNVVRNIVYAMSRVGIKYVRRINGIWEWACPARHYFYRHVLLIENDQTCPECVRIEMENKRKIAEFEQRQKGTHKVKCEDCGFVWKTDYKNPIINCPFCSKKVANDVVVRPQVPSSLPETPKQVEYPNSADGLLRKLQAEKGKLKR